MDGNVETATEDTACCVPVGAVDTGALAADVELLSAMGNDTRYELLRRIDGAGGEVCVCDLESAVGVSQSAVSQALSRLYTAGLVTRRKDGNWRYYGLTDEAERLLATLDAVRGDRQ
ncbi:ArsR/SmtB family transcription factor [Halapricum hydrolyticum]|uniref:Metalloregulator ArsR/SmtB family transcription factor n=1 Tax=Halapricum hydrolyticum TaxID=2979991 RepID=A0AAE3IFH3_9EURY|nr:metalloregulator ArsR/SmtB family transcription factor [Halapricum hydrolyticum]MCU4719372.1 metalloregulator ArsR/SmtB family transcription factor [Halapricum hydrolyticum]MCU4728363.1 metalloregulator ArsR/SmtB family transcription factor [Halapricum hydrolyticum]